MAYKLCKCCECKKNGYHEVVVTTYTVNKRSKAKLLADAKKK